VKDLEAKTPDKDTCILCSQLADEKFNNLHGRIAELKVLGKENHAAMVLTLGQLHQTVDAISSCVSKLTVGVGLEERRASDRKNGD